MKPTLFAVASLALAALAGSTVAAPLNLVPMNPDVASGFISIDYDATTHVFSAQGNTQNLSLPPQFNLGQRQFSLTAVIDNAGNIAGPGSLTIRGDFGGVDQLLFSSNAIQLFGFGATDRFEFVFRNDAGSLAPAGTPIGTILVDQSFTQFPGGIPSFASSFSNRIFPGGPGFGNADSFVVPGPGAAALAGLAGIAALRRRR